MTDLHQWLSSLGLEQYAAVFDQNDLDLGILAELSESDLEALNISLGHRKRLLRAIRDLNQNGDQIPTAYPSANHQAGLPSSVGPASQPNDAQRRYMTIMFCDLADSTAIAAALDIEDMHDLNRAYQSTCASAIRKFGGFVARYMGDGVLAYFGYPVAAENDAERAVLAGMEIINQIRLLDETIELDDVKALSVRIGIASGNVVVETIEDDGAKENAVVGEAPNRAARLQGLAPANALLVAQDTYELLSTTFDFIDLGEKLIKGYTDPINVWQVQRKSPVGQRYRSGMRQYLTPLVGRDEELELLAKNWRRAGSGKGQVVLLSGDAGIGKTRLIDALVERVDGPHHLLRFYCSPYHAQSPLYPVLANLVAQSGISTDDDDNVQYAKLSALLLEKLGFDDNFLHIVTSLIALQVEDRVESLDLDPQQQLQLAQEGLIDHVLDISAEKPVLILVEDTHWVDPSTQKVLRLLVERAQSHPIMLLLSCRTGHVMNFTQPHVTNLGLSKLTAAQTEALINDISHRVGLDQTTVNSIVHKTSGIPLFIEEVTKVMLGSSKGDSGTGGNGSVQIPDTLQASLHATLDRSGQQKYLAQCASVIGDVFEADTLAQISDLSAGEIDIGLDKLVAQNMIFQLPKIRDVRFSFRHALLRDAAYESLLKRHRRSIHQKLGDCMSQADFTGTAPGREVIAYHYSQAGDHQQAFKYWVESGETAFNSGATVEAVELLNSAASHLVKLDQADLDLDHVYRLHMTRGRALNASQGAISEQAHESFRSAVRIGHEIGNIEKEIDALDWEYGIIFNAGMIRKSLVPAQAMLDIGTRNHHIAAQTSGHQALGMTYCVLGEFDTSQHHLESAIDANGQTVTGLNCYPSMSLDYLSYIKFFIGDRESAASLCDQAINSARQESDYATATALNNSCFTQLMLGNSDIVRGYSEEVIELARKRGQHMVINRGLLFQNLAMARTECDASALHRVIQATDALLHAREEIDLSYLIGMTAEIQMHLGDYTGAAASLERAIGLGEKNQELFYLAELYRLKSRLTVDRAANDSRCKASCPVPVQAEARRYLDRALQIAKQQQANGWISRIEQTRLEMDENGN